MAALMTLRSARNFVERQDKASEPSWLKELQSSSTAKPTIMLEKGCPAERFPSVRDWRPRGAEMYSREIPCFTARRLANCLSQAARGSALQFAIAERWPWWKASASTVANT